MQNLLNLWICHCMSHLLFVHLTGPRGFTDLCQHLISALLALLILRVKLQTLLVGLQRLVVFLHEKVRCSFSRVRLHKVRIQLQAFIQIPQSIRIRQELSQRSSAVGVHLGILGISLDPFIVLRLGLCVLLLLEELIAFFPVLFTLHRVKISILLMLFFSSFTVSKRISDATIVVFCERLVVHGDGVIVLLLLLVDGGHSLEDLRDLFKGSTTRIRTVDFISSIQQVLAVLQHFIVVLCSHLDQHRILVVVVRDVVGNDCNGLVVHLQGVFELFLLVQLVTFGFEIICLLLLWRPEILLFLFLFFGCLLLGRWCGLWLLKVFRPHGADIDALHG
mmetsp:Transcript_43252/g.53125  ORF Transcript_43252/g.53125 Transcript_43252/m.53125 type:complete len:334 (-) Transcript_43252:597-1598(-)